MAKQKYRPCDADVERVIKVVVKECYPELEKAGIKALFQLGLWMMGGKVKCASIKPVSQKERYAGVNADILLILSSDIWKGLSPEGKEALIDHEFGHIKVVQNDDGISYRTKRHDVEDFVATVRRRGNWNDELEELANIMKVREEEKGITKKLKK